MTLLDVISVPFSLVERMPKSDFRLDTALHIHRPPDLLDKSTDCRGV